MQKSNKEQLQKNFDCDCQLVNKKINGKQLAEYLGVSYQTIRKWTSDKRIPYIKLSKSVRYDRATIDEYIKSHTVQPEVKQ